MKLETFEEVYEFLELAPKNFNDSTSLIFSLIFKKFEFDENFINNNRASLESEVTEHLRKSREKSQQLMNLKNEQSNRVSYADKNIIYAGFVENIENY